jgi:hypothetical protein
MAEKGKAMAGDYFDPRAPEAPPGPLCQKEGEIVDTYGGEHLWQCGQAGAVQVDGELLCEDHAGELGYGPKQEEYGYDPDGGLNPTPVAAEQEGAR